MFIITPRYQCAERGSILARDRKEWDEIIQVKKKRKLKEIQYERISIAVDGIINK